MSTLDEQHLYIPGRPDYIYYNGKCYKKTGGRVYSGTTIPLSGIAATIDEISTDKPVVVYNSCEDCQGIGELFAITEIDTTIIIRPPGFTDDTYTGTGEVISAPIYTVADVWSQVLLSEVLSGDISSHAGWPSGDGTYTDPFNVDVYSLTDTWAQVTMDQILTNDVYDPHPTDESSSDIFSINSPLSGVPAVLVDVWMFADGDWIGDDPQLQAGRTVEGTASHPAPPEGAYDADTWDDSSNWGTRNNAGNWSTLS
tara:strand:+ start:72 stop:836 length:765 start_codon:yes stop_codon:yes gene_type:complete